MRPAEAQASLSAVADRVVRAIREQDMATLAALSSVQGILLSDLAVDARSLLTRSEVAACTTDKTVRHWGVGSASHAPSSCGTYFTDRFAHADFTAAPRAFNGFVALGRPADPAREEVADEASLLWDDAAIVSFFLRVPARDARLPSGPSGSPKAWSTLRIAFRPEAGQWVIAGLFAGDWQE